MRTKFLILNILLILTIINGCSKNMKAEKINKDSQLSFKLIVKSFYSEDNRKQGVIILSILTNISKSPLKIRDLIEGYNYLIMFRDIDKNEEFMCLFPPGSYNKIPMVITIEPNQSYYYSVIQEIEIGSYEFFGEYFSTAADTEVNWQGKNQTLKVIQKI